MSIESEYRDDAFSQVVKIGKSLGNISRLKILDNLVQGKKSVEELADAIGLTIKTTSKNLQLLKKVGLVKEERSKNFIFYELASNKVARILSLLIDISEENLPEMKQLENDLKAKNSDLKEISISELKHQMVTEDPYLIDLRPISEFKKGHLPGAHNIPYDQIDTRLSDIPKDKNIVVYCRGRLCAYSDVIGHKLKGAGYNVETFNNTVWEWNNAVVN